MFKVLCGECLLDEQWGLPYVGENTEAAYGNVYHKHSFEACDRCGAIDDIPTLCCGKEV